MTGNSEGPSCRPQQNHGRCDRRCPFRGRRADISKGKRACRQHHRRKVQQVKPEVNANGHSQPVQSHQIRYALHRTRRTRPRAARPRERGQAQPSHGDAEEQRLHHLEPRSNRNSRRTPGFRRDLISHRAHSFRRACSFQRVAGFQCSRSFWHVPGSHHAPGFRRGLNSHRTPRFRRDLRFKRHLPRPRLSCCGNNMQRRKHHRASHNGHQRHRTRSASRSMRLTRISPRLRMFHVKHSRALPLTPSVTIVRLIVYPTMFHVKHHALPRVEQRVHEQAAKEHLLHNRRQRAPRHKH